HAVAFHPNGRWVLTAGGDKTMRAWERSTGKPVTPPVATGGIALSLAVTPDGGHAVVGGFVDALRACRLDDLSAPIGLDPAGLCAWTELVSGQHIEDGGGAKLTARSGHHGPAPDGHRNHHPEDGARVDRLFGTGRPLVKVYGAFPVR